MLFLFGILTLINAEAIYSHTLLLVDQNAISPALYFLNSSVSIDFVTLYLTVDVPAVYGSLASSIMIKSCSLHNYPKHPFVSEGNFLLENVSLFEQESGPTRFDSFITTYINQTSEVILTNSNFADIVLPNAVGTFISSGITGTQSAENVHFKNITVEGFKRKHEPYLRSHTPMICRTDFCTLLDSNMENCEDTIYGRFLCGLSFKTYNSFYCSNSTFHLCYRTHTPTVPHSPIVTVNSQCSGSSDVKSYSLSSCNTTSRITFKSETDFLCNDKYGNVTLNYCFFSSCSTSDNGGAIYIQGGSSCK